MIGRIGVLLQQVADGNSLVARLGIAGGAAVFAQRVDGKGLSVDKLLVVNGVALAVEHEVAAAVLLIDEVFAEIVIGALGELEIFFVLEDAVSGCKGPHQAGVEHKALGAPLDGHALARHDTVKASVFLIHVILFPEGENVLQQFLFRHLVQAGKLRVFHGSGLLFFI